MGEWIYSSTHLPWRYMGVSVQLHTSQYLVYAGWVDPTASVEASLRGTKNSVFLGVQP